MVKWVDVITEVKFKEDRVNILEVGLFEHDSINNKLINKQRVYRLEVVGAIKKGNSFITSHKNSDDKLS